MTRLDRSAGYQFVVYGENTPEGVDPSKALFTGGLNGRRITTFSQEVFVPMAVVSHPSYLRVVAFDAPRHPSLTFLTS